jgi:glycosyltransferase involved in cell wall biosynthesis
MNIHHRPLISVLTPVFNGEPYLRECIESVLAQTYENWEYIIVNNCSEDRTLEIAREYEKKDQRIRVYSNDRLLPIIANHNRACSLISPDSKYCKVVSADDWLFPECLARMSELAEANPSVGLVGSYQLSGGNDQWYVRNCGLPYSKVVVEGREMCRAQLLGTLSGVFANSTSNLYRSDLVRDSDGFYPNANPEADVSACFKCLLVSDFGFVHQVLSYERLHQNRETTVALELNTYLPAAIEDCVTYGKSFLTPAEYDRRISELLKDYYRFLSINALKHREDAFWRYHETRLRELGLPLRRLRLLNGICMQIVDLILNPKQTVQIMIRRMRNSAAVAGEVERKHRSTERARLDYPPMRAGAPD